MICFRGFYPALSQQFYLSDNPLYHVGVGFPFDSFSLALSPLDFPFGQSLSEKSVKIIEKPEVSCQISIASWLKTLRELE